MLSENIKLQSFVRSFRLTPLDLHMLAVLEFLNELWGLGTEEE
jgi:hypothetical protein